MELSCKDLMIISLSVVFTVIVSLYPAGFRFAALRIVEGINGFGNTSFIEERVIFNMIDLL